MLPLSGPAARSARRLPDRPGRAAEPAPRVRGGGGGTDPRARGLQAGSDAPVLHWHPPTNGASATIKEGTGELAIRNAFVLGAAANATLPGRQFRRAVRGPGQHGAAGPPDPCQRARVGLHRPAARGRGAPGAARQRVPDRPGTQTAPHRPDPQPAGWHLHQGAAHLRQGGHGEPGRPGDPPVGFVRHVLARPAPSATASHRHRGHGSATATPSPGAAATPTATATATP